jgi:hypothetical protein
VIVTHNVHRPLKSATRPEGFAERFLQAVRLVTTSFVHMGLTPSAHKLCP